MSTIELIAVGGLLVVGIALTYFGYETAQALLATSGLVVGAVVGGWLGLVVGPQLAGGQFSGVARLLVVLVCSVVGASLGRALMPAVGALAVGILGFFVTAIGAVLVFTLEQPVTVLTETVPAVIETGSIALLVEQFGQFELIGGLSPTVALGAIFILATVGGALSIAYSDLILGGFVTVIGSFVLAAVVPLVLERGGVEHAMVPSGFSTVWLLAFAASGLVVWLVRYRNPRRTHRGGVVGRA